METKGDVNSGIEAKTDGSSMTKNPEEAQGNNGVPIKDNNLENKGSEATINDGDRTKLNGEETQENNGEQVMNENLENNKDDREVKDDGLVQTKTNHEISMEKNREHTQGRTEVSMNGETMHTKSGNDVSNKEKEVEVQGESIGDSTKDVNLDNTEDLKRGSGVFRTENNKYKSQKVETNIFYSLQM